MTLLNTAIAVFIGLTIRDILNTIFNLAYLKFSAQKRKDYIDELLGKLAEPEEKPE